MDPIIGNIDPSLAKAIVYGGAAIVGYQAVKNTFSGAAKGVALGAATIALPPLFMNGFFNDPSSAAYLQNLAQSFPTTSYIGAGVAAASAMLGFAKGLFNWKTFAGAGLIAFGLLAGANVDKEVKALKPVVQTIQQQAPSVIQQVKKNSQRVIQAGVQQIQNSRGSGPN